LDLYDRIDAEERSVRVLPDACRRLARSVPPYDSASGSSKRVTEHTGPTAILDAGSKDLITTYSLMRFEPRGRQRSFRFQRRQRRRRGRLKVIQFNRQQYRVDRLDLANITDGSDPFEANRQVSFCGEGATSQPN
jgi:hypothetical protein